MKHEKAKIAFISVISTLKLVYIIFSLWVAIVFFISDAASSFLLVAGFIIWIIAAIISLFFLIMGAYIFLKLGRFYNYCTLIHLIILCISFRVLNAEFAFFIFRISVTIGFSGIEVGLNFIAMPLLVLYVMMSWRYILKEKRAREAEYTCSKCGGDVALENLFCPHCGEDIQEVEDDHD